MWGWLRLDYGKYDSRVISGNSTLEYRAKRHLGLGIGYRLLTVDLEIEDDGGGDRYDLALKGPLLYLSAGF